MATAKSKTSNGAAAPDFEKTVDAGFQAAETVAKSNAEAARKGYETFVSMGREAMDAACKASSEVKGFEKAAEMPKANFEAMIEAGEAFAKGFESFNARLMDIAKAQIADGVAAQKAIFGAKTFQDAMEIQQGFVKKSFDRAMSDGVELQSTWVKAATDAAQPINQRFNVAVSEFGPKVG